MSQSTQPAVIHSAVREQMDKILAHRLFSRSARMCRFLRFAVDHALSGHAGDLKEYVIGVEVFDRSDAYDPRVDPIVRVEARRLRSKLKAYYEADGARDHVLIEFLSGSYAPRIRDRRHIVPPKTTAHVITVVVLPFADLSLKPGNEYFSDGLTEELIHVLTKVAGMRVVAWTTATLLRDRQQDFRAIREQLNAEFVLYRERPNRRAQPAGPRAAHRHRDRRLSVERNVRSPHPRRVRDSGGDRARHRAHATSAACAGQRDCRPRPRGQRDRQLRSLPERPVLLASADDRRPGAQHRVFSRRAGRRPAVQPGPDRSRRRVQPAGGLRHDEPGRRHAESPGGRHARDRIRSEFRRSALLAGSDSRPL